MEDAVLNVPAGVQSLRPINNNGHKDVCCIYLKYGRLHK